jgi:hypothetical protein
MFFYGLFDGMRPAAHTLCLAGYRQWMNLDFTLAFCAAMIGARLVCEPAARMSTLLAATETRLCDYLEIVGKMLIKNRMRE